MFPICFVFPQIISPVLVFFVKMQFTTFAQFFSIEYFFCVSRMSGFGGIRAISGVVIICKWVVC